jgi:ADP-ribose pyrophosphatase
MSEGSDAKDVDAHLTETKVASQAVFDGTLLHVRRDTVRLPDGSLATREFIVHPGAALIVPVLADGQLIALRQFRYPVGQVFLEFPAGKIDPPESALATARRELIEETGYAAATITPLGRIHSVVGYSDEAIDLFVAEGLTFVGARPDVGEFLEILSLDVDAMLAALDRGEITDAKTVAALLLFARRRPS